MSTAFQFSLAGFHEVPNVFTTAHGYGTAVYDSLANTLEYTITITGLDWGPFLGQPPQTPGTGDDVTAAHFHSGSSDANGPVALDWVQDDDFSATLGLNNSVTIHGLWESTDVISINNFSAALAAATNGSNFPLYADVHTTANAGGEIRGQLVGIATDASETVNGTSDPDILPGLGGDDVLKGRDGNDILIGGPGNNTYDGGDGSDTADYALAPAGVSIDLIVGTGSNGYGGTDNFNVLDFFGDPVINVENIAGSAFNDVLTGNDKNNVLTGRGGNNTLNGGGGIDTADYTAAPSGIVMSLTAGGGSNGYGGTDTLIGIENLIGSAAGDTLTGDGNDNTLAGLGGNNILDGAAGSDTVDYSSSPTAVSVNLLAGTASNGYGGTDTLTNIENINGSQFNDTLTGDAADNIIRGGSGNDIIFGGGGNDTLIDLFGDSVLDGGEGNDILIGTDPLGISVDFKIHFDILRGGAGDDTLIGSDGSVMIGGPGADRFRNFGTISYEGSSAGVTVNPNAGTASGGDAFNFAPLSAAILMTR